MKTYKNFIKIFFFILLILVAVFITNTAYAIDADGDGVHLPTDCDDTDPDINPDADEICDDVDNDCDGDIDEDDADLTDGTTYYADVDEDTYGTAGTTQVACEQPTGYVANSTDCDDTDVDVNPGATETCNDVDDDCDGSTDEGLTTSTYYEDADSDGYGDSTETATDCAQPTGYVTDATDCDDTDADVNPGEQEVCDNDVDDDCDGTTDEEDATWYIDADSDTYGDSTVSQVICEQPTGYVADATDCDDTDAEVNTAAEEVCDDSIDNNCDGSIDENCSSEGDATETATSASSGCSLQIHSLGPNFLMGFILLALLICPVIFVRRFN